MWYIVSELCVSPMFSLIKNQTLRKNLLREDILKLEFAVTEFETT